MINQTTTIKHVIAKVLADNDMQEDTLRINDLIEYGAEALERIGAFPELTTVVTGKGGVPLIEVVAYQAELPTTMHSIIQVSCSLSENGPFYPMRTSSGSFDSVRGITTEEGETTEEISGVTSFNKDLVYTLKPGYLNTNVQEGYLMLAYRTIPLDDDGYPTVPDDAGFVDALYWYMTMKLLYPKWATGEVRDAIYYNARSSWNYYSKQAYGNSMMPDGDMLESIKNTWLTLVPELGDHNNFFSTTGQQQDIYNQSNLTSKYINYSKYDGYDF